MRPIVLYFLFDQKESTKEEKAMLSKTKR